MLWLPREVKRQPPCGLLPESDTWESEGTEAVLTQRTLADTGEVRDGFVGKWRCSFVLSVFSINVIQ